MDHREMGKEQRGVIRDRKKNITEQRGLLDQREE
jgi:hypothetical protein